MVPGLGPRPAKKGLGNKAKRFVEGVRHDDALEHARWRLFLGEGVARSLFTGDAQTALRTPAAPSHSSCWTFSNTSDHNPNVMLCASF